MRSIWPAHGLWRHPDFLRLWAAQTVSGFGSRITRTALPVIAIELLAASDEAAALLGLFSILPGVAAGVIAPRLMARFGERALLFFCDVARLVLVLSVPAAALAGWLGLVQIYVVAFLAGMATSLFSIADNTWLPAITGRARIVEGNSKLATTESLAEIGGPAAAGLLIQAITAPFALLADALTYVWSALLLMRIKAGGAPPEDEERKASALEGFRFIIGHAYVRPFWLAELIGMTGWGFFAALYMLFALRVLGLDVALIGILIGLGGLGALIGVGLHSAAHRWLGAGRGALAVLILNMGSALFLPLALIFPPLAPLLLALHQLAGDGGGMAYSIFSASTVQTATPQATLGAVNAAFSMTHAFALVTGSLVATAIVAASGILPALIAGIAFQLAAIAPLAFAPALLRLKRTEDAAPISPATPPSAD